MEHVAGGLVQNKTLPQLVDVFEITVTIVGRNLVAAAIYAIRAAEELLNGVDEDAVCGPCGQLNRADAVRHHGPRRIWRQVREPGSHGKIVPRCGGVAVGVGQHVWRVLGKFEGRRLRRRVSLRCRGGNVAILGHGVAEL